MNIQHCLHKIKNSSARICFLEKDGEETANSYRELYLDALLLLGKLQREGVEPGQDLFFVLNKTRFVVTTLWACWLGGIRPVSLYKFSEQHNRPALLTDGAERAGIRTVFYPQEPVQNSAGEIHPMRDKDIALFQYTSGTSGAPQCVELTGKNLYEGALASSVVVRPGVREKYINWLPLTHIFGLVANHLVPLFNDFDQYHIDTQLFLKDPGVWMRKASETGATISGSTLSGLKMAAKTALDDINLHTMYVCFCGGDTLDHTILQDFENTMAPYGWQKNVVRPAYGLSEATMGVSYVPPGEDLRVDTIDAASIEIGKRLIFCDGERTIKRVSLGILDACNRVEIRDTQGNKLPEEYLGIIYIKGSNICKGYLPAQDPPNPDSSGWLNTGDIGYFRNGWLTVLSRYKAILCHNGVNYLLDELDKTAGRAFSVVEADGQPVLFGENVAESQWREAAGRVSQTWGLPVMQGVILSQLPRTAKGAVDRLALTAGWESGQFAQQKIAAKSFDSLENCSQLAKIWGQVLGIDSGSLQSDAHFFMMGGDSIMLFDLAAGIEKQWGVYVETEELLEALTLQDMTALVQKHILTTVLDGASAHLV